MSRYWTRALSTYMLVVLLATIAKDYLPALPLPAELDRSENVLWVTAHPDDESFFFAPTILNLLQQKPRRGALLCLSTGNHEGLGSERIGELELSHLQDEPGVWWEAAEIHAQLQKWIAAWQPDAIVTFDAYGVSGHVNHRAIGSAMRAAAQTGEYPPIYAVDSTSIFAKFTSVFLLPFVVLRQTLVNTRREDAAVFVNSIGQYRLTRASFHAHQSQARWFRTLFVSFSRYLWYVSVSRVG
ncbi:hypothetical protein B0A53_04571 [Rhodotorula sp. CCFEE 5036]|nr:hypothetical protein B0A53_04571 [Rhodotorula sp. CCFEE 5036]